MDSTPNISKLRWLGRALGACLLFLILGWILAIIFWPMVQQDRQVQLNAERRDSLLLLEFLAVVFVCSFFVAYPRCRWLGCLAVSTIGAMFAAGFWLAFWL